MIILSAKVSSRIMARIEKTVFLSYRRTDGPWGLAIFQHLTQHGYDVFIDYELLPLAISKLPFWKTLERGHTFLSC
jgi:hypothetical protein